MRTLWSVRLFAIPFLVLGWAMRGSAAPVCNAVHSSAPELTAAEMARPLVDEIPWSDWQVKVFESRVSSADPSGMIDVIRSASFDIELAQGLHKASAYYYSQKQAPQLSKEHRIAKLAKWGHLQFEDVRNRALDFVLESYRKRRPHWPANFREKLQRLAIDYEKESTYIMVENKVWAKGGLRNSAKRDRPELFSTIRLIREKNGRIPMENYLGIEIKASPTQLKVEPGNFAMLHEGNEISSVEFAIHLIAQMKRYRVETGREPLFATYADAFSERLYGAMGFQYLRSHMIAGAPESQINENKIHIEKDGVAWAPMYATQSMLRDHLESRLKRAADKRESEKLLHQLMNALQETEKAVAQAPEVFVGFGKNRNGDQDQNPIARLYVRRSENSARLYLQPNYEFPRRVFRSGLLVTVPLPLKEGLEMVTAAGIRIQYSSGKLKMTEMIREGSALFSISYLLAIDPMLTHPISVQVNEMTNTQSGRDAEYFF